MAHQHHVRGTGGTGGTGVTGGGGSALVRKLGPDDLQTQNLGRDVYTATEVASTYDWKTEDGKLRAHRAETKVRSVVAMCVFVCVCVCVYVGVHVCMCARVGLAGCFAVCLDYVLV